MSKRLTKGWTSTAAEAFGAKGEKGHEGELFFIEAYKTLGYKTEHFHDKKKEQCAGIDVIIEKDKGPHTVDVKNNMKPNGTFVVEVLSNGWLFNENYKSDYISHVNPITRTIASYSRAAMQKYILEMDEDRHKVHPSRVFIYIDKADAPPFVKWTIV